MTADGSQYYHTINHGFTLNEAAQVAALVQNGDFGDAIDGVVWRAEIDDCPLHAVRMAHTLGTELGIISNVQVRTVGRNPGARQDDEHLIAERAMLASMGVAAHPQVEATLDTFADIDRGYFIRKGLVDRRYNPNAGWRALRTLHGLLDTLPGEFRTLNSTGSEQSDTSAVLQAIVAEDVAVSLVSVVAQNERASFARPASTTLQGPAYVISVDSGEVLQHRWVASGELAQLETPLKRSSGRVILVATSKPLTFG